MARFEQTITLKVTQDEYAVTDSAEWDWTELVGDTVEVIECGPLTKVIEPDRFGVFVQYPGDTHYTRICESRATGTAEEVANYLAKDMPLILNVMGSIQGIKIDKV